jgi:hypothetical protein
MPSRSPNAARCRNVPGRRPTRARACAYYNTTLHSILHLYRPVGHWRLAASVLIGKQKGLIFDRHFRGIEVRLTALFSRWEGKELSADNQAEGWGVLGVPKDANFDKAEQFGRLAECISSAISPSW